MPVRVLVVCLANTCRSPAGADILRHLGRQEPMEVDSAAVTGWSIGEFPNAHMSKILVSRGIAVSAARRARRIQPHDFESFDYILGVTQDVVDQLKRLTSDPAQLTKVRLLGEFGVKYGGQDIPDPYERDQEMCQLVVEMLEDCCQGFLNHLRV